MNSPHSLRSALLAVPKAIKLGLLLWHGQGWFASTWTQRSMRRDGEPIPWYAYAAIEYLETLDLSTCRVFEYGSGGSSLYWARRAHAVVTIENDAAWAKQVRAMAPANLMVLHETERERYASSIRRCDGLFDLVAIDGRFRHDCVPHACEAVHPDGIVILDNADWHPKACAAMRQRGWFQFDYSGFGPINAYCTTTSLFVRAPVRIQRRRDPAPIGGLRVEAPLDD